MEDDFKKLKKKAKAELEEAQFFYRKRRRVLEKEVREEFKKHIDALEQSLKEKDSFALERALTEYQSFRERHLSGVKFNKTRETIKEILWIFLLVFFIRWLLIEPFRIPSGSMIPTLLVGDQLIVNKFIYGWQIPFTTRKLITFKMPERGEVIVFKYPLNPREDYVKRVIGLPGDRVEMRDGVLFINGKEVVREYLGPYEGPADDGFCSEYDLYQERLEQREYQIILCHREHWGDDFGPIVVPEGRLWAMGDNRDNSADSRSWGFVPINNLKGRAWFIHLPLNPKNHYLPRWTRFFKVIK